MRWIPAVMFTTLTLALAAPQAGAVTFNVLNTESAGDFAGRIESFSDTDPTRTVLADVEPSSFGNIGDWKGFATDGAFFYYLNTNGGNLFPGRIDRTDRDGTNRTTIADLDPSVFNDIEDWLGFATDGQYFYLLNTEGASGTNGIRGRVDRVDLDGTNRVTLFDIEPDPFSNIAAWKGFATDGRYFYLLNTDGGAGFLGRIDRIDFDGTNRTTVMDIDPSPYGAIEQWKGFAAELAIPEPITAGLLSLAAAPLMLRRRRAA